MKSIAKVTGAATVLLLSGCSGAFSTLDPAGPAAGSVLPLTLAMIIVALAVFVGLIVLCVFAVRRNSKDISDAEVQRLQNRWIIAGGIALPTVAITTLLAFGIPIGHSLLPLPFQEGEVMRVDVKARQWFWRVSYPERKIELTDEIHIPVNTPVDFHITSEDVIHSFWAPRLGGKIDAIPGRTNVVRLEADEVGEYRGLCTEYCGQGHTAMQFKVIAHSAEDFEEWLLQQEDSDKND
ncbi:cytochrome c oxidase subunit II [Pseudidiomarina sp. 1APP75-32.1]|uniref:Cytochrome aa3 subunit 2 n=1 Tax=Pseudidiomarina terrestris TaxID=2820060 RepID=A0AAW7R405_9GAMM|nr:cytochrome c oxidase subunit II [Pseudidiomarina sp. 1APP75-32.1]MDN7128078.1 cytochrome c oxidase subunit II [Pseudidiomarina sp. 1APR75-33.1]MDN7130249.1 cytochrome c oxidase subunit II [Pseudidiomarina sp. 1APR75-15]MDN7135758.1 cytochrome c oxidase subunit II [Pseudidiomarina sp. 1ASP75-5]MDN7137205.1 cytochrome c oxidase subunit II [Pseudidiomarina sp. 1ASP75-14]MEA3588501.1 cytochrome c oxidase subunit II [Pseudidiomarina sp. 1APP75-27a]